MLTCYQLKNMNMLEHGLNVHKYYIELYNILNNKNSEILFDIPDKTLTLLKQLNILSPNYVKDYHIYHDCGKHISFYKDVNGIQHFPNHSENSYNKWIECNGDELSGYLIKNDMYFHITKLAFVEKIYLWETLLLTSWSEIHANAEMFGGINSTSFKIKRKQLIKITNKLCTN